ncbi:MAG: hypothetical protein J6P72_09690 [Firmicutes bacterium]|nr:hypothetical protein [Bacillota bacterium]
MAQLYRKSALEKISSPEQLDKALVVSSPASWLALIGLTLIVVVVVIWSFIGTLPTTVSANGIVSAPVSTNAVYSMDAGTVVSVYMRPGQEIHLGDEILRYQTASGESKSVYSDQVGTVSDVLINSGDAFTQGNELIRISPTAVGSQVVVCYVPIASARKIERGMRAQVYLDGIDSQSYGHMVSRVINIDAYAASNAGMGKVLGTDNNLTSTFQQNGAVVAVTCEFYPDETVSGYYWTNAKGAGVTVPNDSTVSVKITTEENAPITKLFSKLKEIWGE